MKPQNRKKPHRATSEIPIIAYEVEDIKPLVIELVDIIKKTSWNYKSEFRDLFIMRDRALVSVLILSGLRISEALSLRLDQIRERPKKFLLLSVPTLKNGSVRKEIELPIDGSLGEITKFFTEWYRFLNEKPQAKWLFPSGCSSGLVLKDHLSRWRAHRIMYITTNLFPHWFRAVCENIFGHVIFENNPYKLKDMMGLKRLESTVPYIQADYQRDMPKLYLI
jgi:integrase